MRLRVVEIGSRAESTSVTDSTQIIYAKKSMIGSAGKAEFAVVAT